MTAIALSTTIGAALLGAALGYFAGERPTASDAATFSAPLAHSVISVGRASEVPLVRATPEEIAAVIAPTADPLRVQTDPAQTLARLRVELNPNRRRRELEELCALLDVQQLKALLAASDWKFSVLPEQHEILGKLLARWAELQPLAAAEFAVGSRAGQGSVAVYSVMQVWARNDPAAARQWALTSTDREAHQSGVNAIVAVLAEADPLTALAFLDELPAAESKNTYIQSLFNNLARKSTAQAAALIPQLATHGMRQAAIEQVATVWGQREPAAALTWFVENHSPSSTEWSSNEIPSEIMKSWVRSAPADAAAFAAGLPLGSSRSGIISALGQSWGAIDPKAAAGWLETLPKTSESHEAFGAFVRSWGQNDPAGAGDFLLARPADRRRDSFLQTLGANWASQDAEAALAWAEKNPEAGVELAVMAPALGGLAAKDLANADTYLAQLKTTAAKDAAIRAVSNRLTQNEPQKAAQWIMSLDAQHDITNVVNWPVRRWAAADPQAVGTWLNEQPASARKDSAVSAYSGELAKKDGEAAAMWAATIGDVNKRQAQIRSVVTTWARTEIEPARTWVREQRFPAADEKALLQQLDSARQK